MSQIRKIRYRLFAWRWFPELKPAQEPIDVVIPYKGYLYCSSTTR